MMKGNTSAVGNNIKSFGESASVAKGSDPMPRGRGQLGTSPMEMNIKDFSKTNSTSSGVQK